MLVNAMFIFALCLIVVSILAYFLFKHEIHAIIHKLDTKDKKKEAHFKIKQLERERELKRGSMGTEMEKQEINQEIEELENLLDEIKQFKKEN